MAAMAQLDCGACGYLCRTYSEAIANGAEKSLTLCSPGGSETSKMLKRLVKEKPHGDAAPAPRREERANTNGKAAAENGSHVNETSIARPSGSRARTRTRPASSGP